MNAIIDQSSVEREGCISEILGKSGMLVRMKIEQGLKARGVPMSILEWDILSCIMQTPGITQQNVSSTLRRDKTLVSRFTSRLVGRGYVIRLRDELDKRLWCLYPTTEGVAFWESHYKVTEDLSQYLLRGMAAEEQKVVIKGLKTLLNNLEEA